MHFKHMLSKDWCNRAEQILTSALLLVPKEHSDSEPTAYLQEFIEFSWRRKHLDVRAGDPKLWNQIPDPLEPVRSFWAKGARHGCDHRNRWGEQWGQEKP